MWAARPALDQTAKEHLSDLLSSQLDWPYLLEQLRRHEIGPLLYQHLQTLPQVELAEEAVAALAHIARAALVHNLSLEQTFGKLLDAFNQAAIPVLPLKGVLLGELLYQDGALRPTGDIDLLVRRADLDRSTELLLALGYQRLRSLEYDADLYHYLFQSSRGTQTSVLIELHWDFNWEHISRLDVQQVWAAARCTTWRGHSVWRMTHADLFLYVCGHAAKDGLASLKALLDIRLLIERFGHQLDWERLAQTVRDAHICTPVWLSLWYSQTLLGAAVPQAFLRAIRPLRGPGWFLHRLLFRWRGGVLHTPTAFLDTPMTTLFLFLWEDRLTGKWRHVRRLVLPPASLRARWTGLPASTSVWRWYPRWLWRIGSKLIRQLVRR